MFFFQLLAVSRLKNPIIINFYLWTVEKVTLVENKIWPICLFNKNNLFRPADIYQIHNYNVIIGHRSTKYKI